MTDMKLLVRGKLEPLIWRDKSSGGFGLGQDLVIERTDEKIAYWRRYSLPFDKNGNNVSWHTLQIEDRDPVESFNFLLTIPAITACGGCDEEYKAKGAIERELGVLRVKM